MSYYNTTFIAVGVAHIIDEKDSLIHYLEKEGYSVKRVEELDFDKK
ncbi:MAG: hypothetical protein ACK41T_00520 [Pseudobdellovibrio sp.]